mgnify:CR=1 FL=1
MSVQAPLATTTSDVEVLAEESPIHPLQGLGQGSAEQAYKNLVYIGLPSRAEDQIRSKVPDEKEEMCVAAAREVMYWLPPIKNKTEDWLPLHDGKYLYGQLANVSRLDRPKGSKLNIGLHVEDNRNGQTLLTLTYGLGGTWSQSILTGLAGLVRNHCPLTPINIQTYYLKSGEYYTYWSNVYGHNIDGKIFDQEVFDKFNELRKDARSYGAQYSTSPPILQYATDLIAEISGRVGGSLK